MVRDLRTSSVNYLETDRPTKRDIIPHPLVRYSHIEAVARLTFSLDKANTRHRLIQEVLSSQWKQLQYYLSTLENTLINTCEKHQDFRDEGWEPAYQTTHYIAQ